jgi:enoyl-CoA hydratase/carnithine racemase
MLASMSAPATDATVLVRADGPAARITLNRPEKRNALSLEVMEELIATLRRLGADPGVQVIVVDSAGPAFSAGTT